MAQGVQFELSRVKPFALIAGPVMDFSTQAVHYP
jgi:hypothetical protein